MTIDPEEYDRAVSFLREFHSRRVANCSFFLHSTSLDSILENDDNNGDHPLKLDDLLSNDFALALNVGSSCSPSSSPFVLPSRMKKTITSKCLLDLVHDDNGATTTTMATTTAASSRCPSLASSSSDSELSTSSSSSRSSSSKSSSSSSCTTFFELTCSSSQDDDDDDYYFGCSDDDDENTNYFVLPRPSSSTMTTMNKHRRISLRS